MPPSVCTNIHIGLFLGSRRCRFPVVSQRPPTLEQDRASLGGSFMFNAITRVRFRQGAPKQH